MSKLQTFGPFPGMPVSRVVRAGDFLYLAGCVPRGPNGEQVDGGIEVQTRNVMEQIKATLAEHGATLNDVCKTLCFLDDPRDFPRFNKIYAEYFGEHKPARSTVRAQLMSDGKVEVECVAYKPV